VQLRAIDGVVGRDVEVVGIGWDLVVFGDISVVGCCTGGNFYHFAKELGLFHGLTCPNTGVQIGGFLLQEVEGNVAKLRGSSTTEEEDAVAFGHLQEFFDKGNGFVDDGLEIFRAVADFHQGKPHVVKFKACFGSGLNDFLWQDGRACSEIELFHNRERFVRLIIKGSCVFYLRKRGGTKAQKALGYIGEM
jgi:hypothetical protein